MIARFTEFFLRNQKITLTLIVIISVFGALAYVLLPKQYNPSIVAPAFSIEVPAMGYTSAESSQFVAKSIENKVRELSGVDKIYSYSTDNFASVMVAFKVGVDQEVAKTRLYDKMYGNYDLRPFGIQDVRIKSIDPEELPQVSFVLTYSGSALDPIKTGIYLRSVATMIREDLKQVSDTTVVDILGGYTNTLSIELDRAKIEAHGLDIAGVINKIKSNFAHATVGNIETGKENIPVFITSSLDRERELEELPLNEVDNKVFLRDVAMIRSGPIDIHALYRYTDSLGDRDAVFLGVAKQKGSNAVAVVERVLEAMQKIEQKIPNNVVVHTIQNEGETAREATSELLFHLFVSIAIVLVILMVFLGVRDALNAAFCIPMVLGIVFLVAFITGLDINRITLFALILSLGILVDDSIVMVENNARHLAMIPRTGRTKIEAVLDSVREVGSSIVFSTVTRVLSFVAMFAVTGMMGDYMKPIPVFASIALTASLFIAFSINPFLAVVFHKNTPHHSSKESKFMDWYGRLLARYVNTEERTIRSRKLLKIGFWIALAAIIAAPILTDVFRARMLPKADKDQVYLWIDAPRNASIETVEKIEEDATKFLLCNSPHPNPLPEGEGTKENTISPRPLGEGSGVRARLCIVENVSASIGDRFLGDFANLFRGGANRVGENQISMRINLVPSPDRVLKSEAFVIAVRPLLRDYLLSRYPDIHMRLLEDPPGPPTQATFHMKLKWQEDLSTAERTRFSDAVQSVVESIAEKEQIVDLSNTVSSSSPRIKVSLDTKRLAETELSADQVNATIAMFLGTTPVSLVHTDPVAKEAANVMIAFPRSDRENIDELRNLTFLNPRGERIKLSDIATVGSDFVDREIYTDNRTETIHLYAELGNNSVVYPVLHLYTLLGSPDFERLGYRKVSAGPYGIEFVGIHDGKEYRIEWGGEWEITMDTFRDLGLAMILSLAGIYFLIVAQFRSFLIGGIVMTTFLLSFFGIFPGFSILYLINSTYFTATAMIGAIALGGIVVGNAIILLDYINQLIAEGKSLEYAVIEGAKKRFVPVMLTSVAAVAGSFVITGDPVWSGLAWSIIWGLSASAILTLFFIPIFYYTYLRKHHV